MIVYGRGDVGCIEGIAVGGLPRLACPEDFLDFNLFQITICPLEYVESIILITANFTAH